MPREFGFLGLTRLIVSIPRQIQCASHKNLTLVSWDKGRGMEERQWWRQIVPYIASGPLSAKLLKNGTLKTHKGFPHGMPTTEAATINADLLAFLKV